MNLKKPVSALLFTESDVADRRAKYALNAFRAFICSRLRTDVDFELLIDMDAVSNFVYCREYKTLELFQRLEKSNEDFDTKDLLNDAIRRQRESILRLDAKVAELRNNTFAFNESDRAEFSLVPVP